MTTSLPLTTNVEHVDIRLPTDEDKKRIEAGEIEWVDHTSLVGISTCPTWGLMHGVHRKRMPGNARAMALEAGSASHEVYAALRLWELKVYQKLEAHAEYAGQRIFGVDRWGSMCETLKPEDDERTSVMKFSLQALYDSGFYDDPRDKRRTMSNIEECLIAYIDKWPFGLRPIWVQDETNARGLVGVEIPVDFIIEFQTHDGLRTYNYRGRADGLHWRNEKCEELEVHENKTASRLDEGWQRSFEMLHSITGYLTGVSLIINKPLDASRVFGMAIPLPKGFDFGGLFDDRYTRKPHHFRNWIDWVWHCTRIIEAFKDNIDDAPRFTHSCNRYFRPCSMIPYCTADDEERALIRDEMVTVPWNPLEDKVRD